MEHNKFTSINNFRNHLRDLFTTEAYQGQDENDNPIYDESITLGSYKYKATHKIGGTNTSIANKDGQLWYQSRETVLIDSDQNGFKDYYSQHEEFLKSFIQDNTILYGEWCGQGVKEKHSISRTEGKKWIIFAVKVNDVLHTEEEFIKQYVNHNLNIYNIYKWGSYDITIDYSGYKWGDWNDLTLKAPAEVMELVDNLTLKCPVSTSFGVNEGIGEGLVLISETISPRTNKPYYLKIKNSKYEVEVLMPNVKDFSVHPNLTSFLLIAVTESRLEQFFDKMENDKVEINMKNVKLFQNLVLADIEKECIDLMNDLGLTLKDYESEVRKKCTEYFRTKV